MQCFCLLLKKSTATDFPCKLKGKLFSYFSGIKLQINFHRLGYGNYNMTCQLTNNKAMLILWHTNNTFKDDAGLTWLVLIQHWVYQDFARILSLSKALHLRSYTDLSALAGLPWHSTLGFSRHRYPQSPRHKVDFTHKYQQLRNNSLVVPACAGLTVLRNCCSEIAASHAAFCCKHCQHLVSLISLWKEWFPFTQL